MFQNNIDLWHLHAMVDPRRGGQGQRPPPPPWAWGGSDNQRGAVPRHRTPAFWEELQRRNSVDVSQEWIQQDGATPHTAAASRAWLQERFPDRAISLREEVEWAPRYSDLSRLEFFLWGYLKSRVYAEKPRTSEQLKRAIIVEVGRTPTEMVDRAVGYLQTVRLPQVISRSGAHIELLL